MTLTSLTWPSTPTVELEADGAAEAGRARLGGIDRFDAVDEHGRAVGRVVIGFVGLVGARRGRGARDGQMGGQRPSQSTHRGFGSYYEPARLADQWMSRSVTASATRAVRTAAAVGSAARRV